MFFLQQLNKLRYFESPRRSFSSEVPRVEESKFSSVEDELYPDNDPDISYWLSLYHTSVSRPNTKY